jgi:hypothetical protein
MEPCPSFQERYYIVLPLILCVNYLVKDRSKVMASQGQKKGGPDEYTS